MLSTYRAILNGNRITWLDSPPPQVEGVEVHVTLLKQVAGTSAIERGRAMAAVLAQLAQSNPFASINDPTEWQRRIREDRDLPQRY